MKTIKYKTTINCNGCVNAVSPFLNELENIDSWKVDVNHPDKILEVVLDDRDEKTVIKTVKKAGFEIEKI
ncbi:heavy-metal-associated domain-containing protein [Flexithrix dorotheae]|uniref:heavy-metal-associated domain-containing protein n=1 Tax=Flexithrix dorotheae TaxID=70993 RepID=UPI00035CBC16|nr:cation transporter [Flexithrix dorotheae]